MAEMEPLERAVAALTLAMPGIVRGESSSVPDGAVLLLREGTWETAASMMGVAGAIVVLLARERGEDPLEVWTRLAELLVV